MNKRETSHTPGPWSAEECRSGFAVYAHKSGDAVVRTEDDEGRYGPIANEADARLIAAAPELLALLKRICYKVGADCDGGVWREGRAAIDKVEGRVER